MTPKQDLRPEKPKAKLKATNKLLFTQYGLLPEEIRKTLTRQQFNAIKAGGEVLQTVKADGFYIVEDK